MRIGMQTRMQIGIQYRVQGIDDKKQLQKNVQLEKNMKIQNFFLFLCVSFALLDPDPHTAWRSGRTRTVGVSARQAGPQGCWETSQ